MPRRRPAAAATTRRPRSAAASARAGPAARPGGRGRRSDRRAGALAPRCRRARRLGHPRFRGHRRHLEHSPGPLRPTRIAECAARDAAQTRALRGPRADPAAYLLVSPSLPQAVYVLVPGSPPEPPYWLIATRKPAELAAAIERARPGRRTSAADGHAEDGGGIHQAPGAVG